MKYAFIQRHRLNWPIKVQCRVLGVSLSGYRAHLARENGPAEASRRCLSEPALLAHVKAVHAQSRGSYGRPRILRQLRRDGVHVGKERLQGVMREHGIMGKAKRRFQVTTDSNHTHPIAPNLLDRKFNVTAPDRVWVGDITYIPTDEGWVFLAVVIDLFSRQIVGWSLRDDMPRDIVIDALTMAWFKRNP